MSTNRLLLLRATTVALLVPFLLLNLRASYYAVTVNVVVPVPGYAESVVGQLAATSTTHDDDDDSDIVPSKNQSAKTQHQAPAVAPEVINDDVGEEDGFSACLLIKDDNHLLNEWIAYHYLVLPLKYLIVAVDPTSKTSPLSILQKWNNDPDMDVSITMWQDEDYWDPQAVPRLVFKEKQKDKNRVNIPSVQLHLQRQQTFYAKCMQHHHKQNRSWTLLIDTDEFLAFNAYHVHENAQRKLRKTKSGKKETKKPSTKVLTQYAKKNRVAPYAHNRTILSYLHEHEHETICILATRTLFGPRLLSRGDGNDKDLGPGNDHQLLRQLVEKHQLRSMKYFYHDELGVRSSNGFGKSFINVRYLGLNSSYDDFDPDNVDIHAPSKKYCTGCGYFLSKKPDHSSLFRIQHYLGTKEEYLSFREDQRRSIDLFDEKASASSRYGPYTEMLPWLNEFVRKVGSMEKADMMLSYQSSQPPSQLPDEAPKTSMSSAEFPNSTLLLAAKKNDAKTCAILLFGLPRKFAAMAYPSLEEHVLETNPGCSVFVHTFNTSVSMEGEKNATVSVGVDIEELQALKADYGATIIYDTEEEFQLLYDLEYYRGFFPHDAKAWTYPTSIDNMIRQWHSIESVFHLMEQHETERNMKFERVGLFRLDVLYHTPIPIMNDALAVIPSMMYASPLWPVLLNDRMFYGERKYAKIWATDRFKSVPKYLKWDKHSLQAHKRGMHSEQFMYFLLREKWEVPFEEKDYCFERLRATGKRKVIDCRMERKRRRKGVIVLGMHRSGTSMLAGLLVQAGGLISPGELLLANSANPLGYFENRNVMFQNDVWLTEQGFAWDYLVKPSEHHNSTHEPASTASTYDPTISCVPGMPCEAEHDEQYFADYNEAMFAYGRGIGGWVMKDPRLCITLPIWLSALREFHGKHHPKIPYNSPATVFTYRHPLEVAGSLQRRPKNKVENLADGLSLWIRYNQMAIVNSQKLCRVVTRCDQMRVWVPL